MESTKVKLLSPLATMPTRGTPGAAGFDLYAAVSCELLPGSGGIIQLDISMEIPPGYYGRIAPRSSLAVKNHINVHAGVVDSDYRGAVAVVLFNHGTSPYLVKPGERVAQMIITPYNTADCILVDTVDDTQRGTGGFGSTGV
jgi:dUTP pyrophosphatase